MPRTHIARLFFAVLLSLSAIAASGRLFDADAMPPYLDENGTPPTAKLAAAINDYAALRASFAERGICTPGGGMEAGAQVSGNFNILAICVQFPDKLASVLAQEFDTLIFQNVSGTVRHFYGEMSYGTLTLVTVNLPSTLGWVLLPTNHSYYVDSSFGLGAYPQNTQKLCEDLVDLIDPLVNFSQYDNDGNGYVDGIVIAHTGKGAEFSGSAADIWSHKWGITPRWKDGVRVSAYSIQPEYWSTPGDITIGVYAHEIGHLFGLPDLYDIDGSSRGIGKWSLMSHGTWNGSLGNSPAHMDAWCKMQVGWVTPTNVTTNMTGAVIPRVMDNSTVFRLWADGAIGNQYFLVENRQKVGYDSFIPGAGLCIWHIDDAKTSNAAEWYPGHTSTGNFWVAMEQADALWEMEQSLDQGDAADPFPGTTNKTTFSAATSPNSDAYSGTQTYVTITNISPSGNSMTCDFQVSLVAAVLDETGDLPDDHSVKLGNYPNPFNASTRVEFTSKGDGDASLVVYDILGRHVATLYDGALEPGQHQLEWNGERDDGHHAASGVYFARLETAEGLQVRKMVLLR